MKRDNMQGSIHMIRLNNMEIHFYFNEDNKPTIEIKGKAYTSLSSLFRDFPFFSRLKNQEKIAQLINFLLKGLEFYYIENITEFQESYRKQIEIEQLYPEEAPLYLKYGIYDVSIMHPPLIKNRQLIFFVKQDYTQMPYQVTVPFPIVQETVMAYYELLPFIAS
jgi:hypothetical protein